MIDILSGRHHNARFPKGLNNREFGKTGGKLLPIVNGLQTPASDFLVTPPFPLYSQQNNSTKATR